MYKLRDYQEEAIKAGVKILSSNEICKELLVLPTASGKSIIIAKAVQEVKENVIILQPSKELLAQNFDKFKNVGGQATIYSASLGKKELSKVTFATIGSIVKEIPRLKNLKIKLIIDEAHLGVKSNSQLRTFIKELKIKNVLGLTATPFILSNKMGGSELQMLTKTKHKLFNDISYVYQIQEMVANNYWCKLQYKVVNQKTEFLKANTNGSEFTEESIIKYYEGNDLSHQIVDLVAKAINYGKRAILVFVPTINYAEELARMIPDSACVSSQTPKAERDDIIERFRLGTIKTIFNVGILTTGFDYPELDTIISARSTMSFALYYQIIGRGVRIVDGVVKTTLFIDLSESFARFGRLEAYTIENIPGYGWALMRGNDLISNYPIEAKDRPKRSSLDKTKYRSTTVIPFGKYKEKTIEQIYEIDKGYLVWIYENVDFQGRIRYIKQEIAKTLNVA